MKKKLAVLLTAVSLLAVFAFTACGATGNTRLFGKEILTLEKQSDILVSLDTGSADIGVMDSIMAHYYMTTGSYAASMQVLDGMDIAEEEYGIAAKNGGKAFIGKVNEAIIALSESGKVLEIAEDFGLESELLISGDTVNPDAAATDDSWDKIVSSKKVNIGYTVFAPIAFEKSGTLTGFDIELAKAVFDYLNTTYNTEIEIEFVLITWSAKETKLDNGDIDLIWNGMTITDERIANMQIGVPYLANKQACVIRKADFNIYNADSLTSFFKKAKDAIVAVESGSAAHDCMDLTRP